MSKRSVSLRPRSKKYKDMDDDTESIVSSVKSYLTQINEMLAEDRSQWESHLPAARSAIAMLDRIPLFNAAGRLPEQTWMIQVLQDFAYHDSDEGAIQDIADWCRRSWLRVLQYHPEAVEVLRGLGQNWLQRSQAALARIHQEEGSSSSSGSDPASAQRVQSPLFVEARGILQPAVDFYARAVNAAERNGTLTGDLLASTAEAYMNLGNVSPMLTGEQHFVHAIRYLRRASAIPSYTLSVYHQQYLDSYGRFVQ